MPHQPRRIDALRHIRVAHETRQKNVKRACTPHIDYLAAEKHPGHIGRDDGDDGKQFVGSLLIAT